MKTLLYMSILGIAALTLIGCDSGNSGSWDNYDSYDVLAAEENTNSDVNNVDGVDLSKPYFAGIGFEY